MVWLILFLTVSNIAIGYGLAVYIDRQFGTLIPQRGRGKDSVPAEPEALTVPPAPVVSVKQAATTKQSEPATPTPAAVPAEPTAGLPPVDEENVLAGIEEFRSQLAKMNVTSEESAEGAAAEEVAVAN